MKSNKISNKHDWAVKPTSLMHPMMHTREYYLSAQPTSNSVAGQRLVRLQFQTLIHRTFRIRVANNRGAVC